jgi:hypothetical protein
MKANAWRIAGDYLENCNCEVLCPCLLGPRDARGLTVARPTEGHCDVPIVFHVGSGRHGSTTLDGTSVALAIYTPREMGAGEWTAALYLDGRASEEQRAALEAIFSGAAGGVMARMSTLVGTRLPTRVVDIEFGKEGRRRWARIPGVLDVEIEGIEGRAPGSETWIDNVRHFVSGRLAAARATRSSYRDHGWTWSHVGRNGHYASFDWTGP